MWWRTCMWREGQVTGGKANWYCRRRGSVKNSASSESLTQQNYLSEMKAKHFFRHTKPERIQHYPTVLWEMVKNSPSWRANDSSKILSHPKGWKAWEGVWMYRDLFSLFKTFLLPCFIHEGFGVLRSSCLSFLLRLPLELNSWAIFTLSAPFSVVFPFTVLPAYTLTRTEMS